MEALVITLREGIEAALVVSIVLAYLRKTGRDQWSRFVFWGLALAIVGSLGVGWWVQSVGVDPENEYLEGALLGGASLLVLSMVVWMWRTSKNLRREMEQRLTRIVASEGVKSTFKAGAGLFFFTFVMVFREGIETVVFLSSVALGEAANVLDVVGGILGLAVASLFAVLLVRGSLRINLARFFQVTSAVLVVLGIKLLGASLHEFGEVRLIPLTREAMALLGFLVRDQSSTLIVTGLIALPIFMLLWETRQHQASAIGLEESSAERRKRLAAARLERFWQGALGLTTLFIIVALVSAAFTGNKLMDPLPKTVADVQGSVRIPLSTLAEERLDKFVFDTGSAPVRFLLTKLPDGTVVGGLDACPICGAVGYGQEGKMAICKNCNAPIALDTFAFGGGCNPIPLSIDVAGDDVLVAKAELEQAVVQFR